MAPDEYAFLLDLHLFLGRPLSISTPENKNGAIGRIPSSLLEEQHSYIMSLHEKHIDLVGHCKYRNELILNFTVKVTHWLLLFYSKVLKKVQRMDTVNT